MAAASQWTFRFGVELEFLLGSRSKKHKSWTALAEELSTRLARHGVPNHVNAGGEKTAENYREWSIVREVTVPADVSKGLCKSARLDSTACAICSHTPNSTLFHDNPTPARISHTVISAASSKKRNLLILDLNLIGGTELVSPILSPASSDDGEQHWAETLHTIFAVLTRHFILVPTTHAGTHVHVSCEPAVLATNSNGALTAVAKAALYFEPALDALMPASRSGAVANYWCQSNRNSVKLKDLPGGLEGCFALLDAWGAGVGGGAEPVVHAMCLFPASSPYGRSHGYKTDFVHGVYKWDFSGLLPDTGSGTLEYRQVSQQTDSWPLCTPPPPPPPPPPVSSPPPTPHTNATFHEPVSRVAHGG